MFARAGISGRILRNANRRGTQGSVLYSQPRPRKPKRKFRCYVPFMWSTCVAVFVGLFILMGGTAMCSVGYYADFFSSEEVKNDTHTWSERSDHTQYRHIRALAYAGPIFMGCGCFIIVIACVVICETRDKMIKIMEQQEKEKKAKEARVVKPNFYDLIIGQVRRDRAVSTSEDKDNRKQKLKEFLLRPGSAKSVKSEYSCVSKALKRIPADIFTIDVEGGGQTTMAPIHMAKPHTLHIGEHQVTTKYPSASCLHDLLVMEDEELNKLFDTSPDWLSSTSPTSPTKVDPELVQSPEHSTTPSPTEKRPKLYDDDTGSVYSLNPEEHADELESRLPTDRPKSSMSRPRTPGTGIAGRKSESPARKSSPSRRSISRAASRIASRAEFSDESDMDIDIHEEGGSDFDDSDAYDMDNIHSQSRAGSGKRQKDDNDDVEQDIGRHRKRPKTSKPRNRDPNKNHIDSPERFGATCDTNDTFEPLGKNGLHGTSGEEGVSRATTPAPGEKEAYNSSNIIVHAAVHQEPALTEDDVESVLSQSFASDGEGRFSPVRRGGSRAAAVVSPIPSEQEDGTSLDSVSLPDTSDAFDKSSHSISAGKVFQHGQGRKQTTDKPEESSLKRPKTGIPGTNRDMVKVPALYREPNPRPKTSFMRPAEPNPQFPTKRKSDRNFAYSRNMPRLQSASLGNVGLRPIRTNIKTGSQSNAVKGRPKTSVSKSRSNAFHNSGSEDKANDLQMEL